MLITEMRWKRLPGISLTAEMWMSSFVSYTSAFVVESAMNPERVRALYDVCHAYWITTKVPDMKYIHVIAEDGTITQKVPYTESGARVFLYAKTDRLVWEAKDGRHYTDFHPI